VRGLRRAAFFVGLSSARAWLAWAVGVPVVLIRGFARPTNAFATPYGRSTGTPATAAGTTGGIALTTRICCGVRATPARRASSRTGG
jgi:hypothetical protein